MQNPKSQSVISRLRRQIGTLDRGKHGILRSQIATTRNGCRFVISSGKGEDKNERFNGA